MTFSPMVEAIAQATAWPDDSLAWDAETEGPLRAVPVYARAFHPGERTTDLGRLGAHTLELDEQEPGVELTIKLDLDEVEDQLAEGEYGEATEGREVTIGSLRWWLHPGVGTNVGNKHANDADAGDGENDGDAGENNADDGGEGNGADDPQLTQTRSEHTADGLLVRAGLQGPWRLVLQLRDEDGSEIGEFALPLSVPLHLTVDADPAHLESVFDDLDVPDDDEVRQDLWGEVVAQARRITAHVLRPVNVRLWWLPDDDAPGPNGSDDPTSTKDHVLLTGASPHAWLWQARHIVIAPPGVAVPSTVGVVGNSWADPPSSALRDDPSWYFDPPPNLLGGGVVRAGLGALAFDGGAATEGSEVDRVLAAAAAAAADAGFTLDDVATERWIELNARLLAVAVARSVVLLAGINSNATTERDTDEREQRPGVDLLEPTPEAPLRQLLGLHRPDAASLDAIFGQDDGEPVGLDHQAANPATHDLRTSWTDLVAYYHRAWQPDEDRRAHPDGERLTAYDVLAGLVLDASLDSAARRLPLPPPYGGYELTYGDVDAGLGGDDQPRYGGQEREPVTSDDERQICNLQYDLRQVGITLGLDPENAETAEGVGRFGYRRWTLDEDKWDGAYGDAPQYLTQNQRHAHAPALIAGNTSMSVRELRLAGKYPNRVFERLDGAPDAERPDGGVARRAPASTHHNRDDDGDAPVDTYRHRYGDALVAVQTGQAPEADGDGPGVDNTLVGELSVDAAVALRRWRFARRRYPVAFEARNMGANRVQTERLMGSRGWTETAERTFYRDLSGYFSSAEGQWQTIGDFARWGGWSGPRVHWNNHAQTEMTQHDLLPDDATNAATSVYGVIADSTRPESRNHFDVFNNYDDAVTSLPLGHYTLALGDGQTDGQYARLVRFLRSDADDLADAGVDSEVAVNAAQALNAAHEHTFGYFGAVASELDEPAGYPPTGYVCIPWTDSTPRIKHDQPPGDSEGTAPERSLYQAYVQWFRAWPWLHRAMAAIRTSPRLRSAMYAFEVANLRHLLDDWDGTIAGEPTFTYLSSERDLAYALRAYIRAPQHLVSLQTAVTAVEDARTAWADYVLAEAEDADVELNDDHKQILEAHQEHMTARTRNQVIFSELSDGTENPNENDRQHLVDAEHDDNFNPVPEAILGDADEDAMRADIGAASAALAKGFGDLLLVSQVNAETDLASDHQSWGDDDTVQTVTTVYQGLLTSLPGRPLREPADNAGE